MATSLSVLAEKNANIIVAPTINNDSSSGGGGGDGDGSNGGARRRRRDHDTPSARVVVGEPPSSSTLHPVYGDNVSNSERWIAISFAVFDYMVAVVVGYWVFVILIQPYFAQNSD